MFTVLAITGQFTSWSRDSDIRALGVPNEDTLYDMVMRYCARRSLYNSAEVYPWQANAHYSIVTSLCSQMKSDNLAEAALRKACRTELEKMSLRIREWESTPQLRAQLEKIYVPVSSERARAHISRLKMLLKRNSKHGLRPVLPSESEHSCFRR